MSDAQVRIEISGSATSPLAETLCALETGVESIGQRERWSEALVYRVNLVLDELVTNALSHGRRPESDTPEITIAIDCADGAIRIEVTDDGRAFDPVADAPPAPAQDGTDRQIQAGAGGLGLHLVRSIAHTMAYRHEAGRNRLTLTINAER